MVIVYEPYTDDSIELLNSQNIERWNSLKQFIEGLSTESEPHLLNKNKKRRMVNRLLFVVTLLLRRVFQ